jgi:ligand-binding SRPBCC domain-containing protein
VAPGDQETSGGGLTRIVIETLIDSPPEICFDLALDVDAHVRSAAFSSERVVEPGRLSGGLELDDLITFEGKHFGIRQRFTAKIVELNRPHVFVDEMVSGAFKSLRHVHEFHPREGGTLMRDILEWRAPLGILGRFADWLFLKRHMRRFVTRKQRHLKRIAEGEK